MSSPADPARGPEEPLQSRIYVPEGPAFDAWNAPGGGAVKLSVLAMKMQARWLRRARPRPFGFAPGGAHPMPAGIEDAYGAGTLSRGLATVLGLRTAVHTMSVRYGDADSASAPAARIISDFHRDYRDRDLEEMLRQAAAGWAGQQDARDARDADGQVSGSRPKITPAAIDVVVSGRRRPVSLLRLGEFSAFRIREGGAVGTVLTRHLGPQFDDIVRLRPADLEPMLSAMENPDQELIAAALAEVRRRHIEQMRNQTPHDS
jgi:hypothetical protein